MTLYKNKYRVESARLRSWDYSNVGYYFITICTKNNTDYFGAIDNNKMQNSKMGDIIEKYWHDIPNHFENIDLDEFIIMPNHIHGIIIIDSVETSIYRVSKNAYRIIIKSGYDNQKRKKNNDNIEKINNQKRDAQKINKDYDQKRDVINHVCTEMQIKNPMNKNSLSKIVRWFKGRVTYEINKSIKTNFGWHPRFHDHIIRTQSDLDCIREYIKSNPENWESDRNFKIAIMRNFQHIN